MTDHVLMLEVEKVGVVEFHTLSGRVYQVPGCSEIKATLSEVIVRPEKCPYCGTRRKNRYDRCPECAAPSMEER